jgi:hypothetical protein
MILPSTLEKKLKKNQVCPPPNAEKKGSNMRPKEICKDSPGQGFLHPEEKL